jgi:hypothetical protein
MNLLPVRWPTNSPDAEVREGTAVIRTGRLDKSQPEVGWPSQRHTDLVRVLVVTGHKRCRDSPKATG